MTAPILDLDLPPEHPLRQVLDFITAHPEVRQPVLRALLTEEFLALPAQVQELSGRVDGVAGQIEELRDDVASFKEETREQFQQVNARIDETNRSLGERIDETNRSLGERIDETNRSLGERIEESRHAVIREMKGSLGRFRGETYERKCAEKLDTILVDHFHYAVEYDRTVLTDRLVQARHDRLISRAEYLDARNVDIVAQEKPAPGMAEHLAVVEVSITFNRDDLETASRRAAIIGRIFELRTEAFVATNGPWPDEVDEVARQLGVTIVRHFLPEFVAE